MGSSEKNEGEADEVGGVVRIIAMKRIGGCNRKCMMKGEKGEENIS